MAKGDINQDEIEDIIGGGYWFEHKGDHTYEDWIIDDYGQSISAVVNGDGRPDIIQKPFMKGIPRLDLYSLTRELIF